MRYAIRSALAILVALAFMAAPDTARSYPDKPIQLVVNFGAGGTTDAIARIIAEQAGKTLGQNIVVENKPGAGGTIGIAELSKRSADGYAIGTCNMPAVSIIPQMRSVPYDPDNDLIQVAALMPYEYAIFAHKDAPYNTWDELVEFAKKNPGKLTYGTVGAGTTNHLTMERIAQELGIEWQHAPFKGGAKAIAALIGGHVNLVNNTIVPVLSALRAGEVKAILVTSERRFDALPDVPTMSDEGFDFSQISYLSIVVPKGTPDDVIAKLDDAFKEAVANPEVLAAAKKLDLYPAYMSGADYSKLLAKLKAEWTPVIEKLGLKEKK